MKAMERIGWGRRAVTLLRGIEKQLKRIADLMEASVSPEIDSRSAFRSYYDDRKEGSDLVYLDDEDQALEEQRQKDEKERGGPAVDGFYEGDDRSVVGPTVTREEE